MYCTSFIWILTAVTSSIVGHVIPANDHRIGGGLTAERGQFPFIVALRSLFKPMNETALSHICGGTILNERWILTAAHCVFSELNNTFVQVGAHHLTDDGVQHTARRIIEHEGYHPMKLLNDIALIELNEPIQFNRFAQPIELETKFIGAGENATIIGWGRVEFGGKFPEYLQFMYMRTLTNIDCAARFPDLHFLPEIKPNEICLYDSRIASACQGDSGGPAVLNGRLIGLTSWSLPPCITAGRPMVYVRISEHLEWIAANMQ